MDKIFNNTEVAFSLKSDTELNRAYFLFKMIANEPLVRIGTAVTNFALKLHLPVDGLIRATVFDHFCGGVNEMDCLSVVDKMYTKGVSSVLDYSVEGKEEEAQFDAALEMTLKTVEFAKERQAIPFAVFKPTGLGRLDLYTKVGEKQPLSAEEQAEWNKVKERFEIICKTAHSKDVALLIDGEESWMQDAADDLVEEMTRLSIFPQLEKDEWGNYFTKIGNSRTIFASHLDTAHRDQVDVNHLISKQFFSILYL